jgi:hypothetical protein
MEGFLGKLTPKADPDWRVKAHEGAKPNTILFIVDVAENGVSVGAYLYREDALAVVKMLLDAVHALGDE